MKPNLNSNKINVHQPAAVTNTEINAKHTHAKHTHANVNVENPSKESDEYNIYIYVVYITIMATKKNIFQCLKQAGVLDEYDQKFILQVYNNERINYDEYSHDYDESDARFISTSIVNIINALNKADTTATRLCPLISTKPISKNRFRRGGKTKKQIKVSKKKTLRKKSIKRKRKN
jgi:hypothetical protein